jgi:hypothetical protein
MLPSYLGINSTAAEEEPLLHCSLNRESKKCASRQFSYNNKRNERKRETSNERARRGPRAVAAEQSKQALVFALCAVVVAL